MNPPHGIFTVSLDLELYWGVRDKRALADYRQNLLGVRQAVPEMLRAFTENGVHATWAAVGFLFFQDLEHLRQSLPHRTPQYVDRSLSPYRYISEAGDLEGPCHFVPDLIALIRKHAGQEIGTHTFSHYYCLEEGQTVADFREDLLAAVALAKREGISIRSLVFPRNQWDPEYLPLLSEAGVRCYRGNEAHWLYAASEDAGQGRVRRALRLIDAYVPLSGHHTYSLSACAGPVPLSFPSSRFLRPYSRRLAPLEGLRLRRVTRAMDCAARHGQIYHLWWHPHNFGANTPQNIAFLRRILDHFRRLRDTYGMQSLNMGELCSLPGMADGD